MPSLDELIVASKDYIKGMIKGNTIDVIGAPVDLAAIPVNTALKLVGQPEIKAPVGGSVHLRKLVGLEPDRNLAETTGSFISVGGAVKALAGADKSLAILGAAITMAREKELTQFSELERLGKSPKEMFAATGIYRGPLDKQPRAVIDDSKATLVDKKVITQDYQINDPKTGKVSFGDAYGLPQDRTLYLNELIDHPELFKAYPELKQVIVRSMADSFAHMGGAQYWEKNQLLEMGQQKSPKDFMRVLLHETQHAVQGIEGFTRGGSQAHFSQDYQKFATARDVLAHKLKRTQELFVKSLPNGVTLDQINANPERFKELAKLPAYQEWQALDRQKAVINKASTEAWNNYRALGGEAESRAVESMFANPTGTNFPLEHYDVPLESLIDPAFALGPLKIENTVPELESTIDKLLSPAFK